MHLVVWREYLPECCLFRCTDVPQVSACVSACCGLIHNSSPICLWPLPVAGAGCHASHRHSLQSVHWTRACLCSHFCLRIHPWFHHPRQETAGASWRRTGFVLAGYFWPIAKPQQVRWLSVWLVGRSVRYSAGCSLAESIVFIMYRTDTHPCHCHHTRTLLRKEFDFDGTHLGPSYLRSPPTSTIALTRHETNSYPWPDPSCGPNRLLKDGLERVEGFPWTEWS